MVSAAELAPQDYGPNDLTPLLVVQVPPSAIGPDKPNCREVDSVSPRQGPVSEEEARIDLTCSSVRSGHGACQHKVTSPVMTLKDRQQHEGVGAVGHHPNSCVRHHDGLPPAHEVPAFGFVLPSRASGGLLATRSSRWPSCASSRSSIASKSVSPSHRPPIRKGWASRGFSPAPKTHWASMGGV